MSGHAIALDLGGTKLLGAIADHDGQVLAERVEPTRTDSAEALLAQLRDVPSALVQEAGLSWPDVRALALGVPGTVDQASGRIGLAYNLPDLAGFDLADELATLGDDLRVVVENDVNAAALGERWRGQARDTEHFVFVAIGTGIGAGVVVDGRLCRGVEGGAGEIGYLPIGGDPFDPRVRRHGVLEAAVAGRGIVADVERGLAAGKASELTRDCTAADVFAAAGRGDELAAAAVDREARLIALTVGALASVTAPELIVLGGGIGANELLLEPVRRYSRELLARPLRVERSALGPRAALIGSLALALQAGGAGAPAPPPPPALPMTHGSE